MIIKYLYIDDYKMFKKREINFLTDESFSEQYRAFYGSMNFTVLVGENGVGKTTIMSFIGQIFHNLERFQSRIESDFEIHYAITDKENKRITHEIKIRKENNNIYIKTPEHKKDLLLLEWHHFGHGRGEYRRKRHQYTIENETTTFIEIAKYLPDKVVTSIFSIHGEYPKERPHNYYGEELIQNNNINNIYIQDSYYGQSISKGIAEFVKLYYQKNETVKYLIKSLGLEFSEKIKIYPNLDYLIDYGPYINLDLDLEYAREDEEGWLDLRTLEIEQIMELIEVGVQNQDVYFNDLLFYKNNGLYKVSFENMSSGEKMFLYRVFSIMGSITDDSIVIIEEPELHLNPSWTKQIITMLYLLFQEYNAHFIIATHSYSFINSLFPENILVINFESIKHPTFNTFMSVESEITQKLFENSTRLNYPEAKLNELINNSSKEDLKKIRDVLGESYYKFLIINEIEDL
ncbi:AAA family ATPase [Bacillus cereus]|uniref:AAA family ATPase n=1 Tax=Bacillus cereus TaxID=1396 RepID=UPI003D065547